MPSSSSRHGATQTTPWSAIPKTRRHPEHALLTNPDDTAPPTPCPDQQSPRHGATERTACPAIPMAKGHPRETPSSNPHGTAPPTRHAQQQSPWHSGTHATRPAAIPTAQRRTRDTPDAHRHSLPLRSSAARPTRPTQPAAAFPETSAPSSHPQIHGFPAPATISQRPTRARARDFSHRATKTSDFGDRARFIAPATRIHRAVPLRGQQCIRSPTPATRNAGRSA